MLKLYLMHRFVGYRNIVLKEVDYTIIALRRSTKPEARIKKLELRILSSASYTALVLSPDIA